MQKDEWNRRENTRQTGFLVYNQYKYGDVKVSTGVWKPDKRAAVCSVCVKKGTLNINAKNNNSFALAA